MKDTISGNIRDPMFRVSRERQKREKNRRVKNGKIRERMIFEGLFKDTVYGRHTCRKEQGCLKGMVLSNYGDPSLKKSRRHQERWKNILANNGTIWTKMNFEGLSGHTV